MNATITTNANWYDLLGVSPRATASEIRSAYLSAAKQHHPDAGGDPSGVMFKAVNQAYKILSDSDGRRAYDASIGETQRTVRKPRRKARTVQPTVVPEAQYDYPPPYYRRRRSRSTFRFATAVAMVFFVTFGALFIAFASAGDHASAEKAIKGEYTSSLGDSARACATFVAYAKPLTSDRIDIERLASGETGLGSSQGSNGTATSVQM